MIFVVLIMINAIENTFSCFELREVIWNEEGWGWMEVISGIHAYGEQSDTGYKNWQTKFPITNMK